ncbi:recombinase family protein [Mesorhizobium sp. AR02]|uniref:recombinase family protein n=1 Tax=Mesorhizobium sp. AR02 TaxID=2865837 RepID=UPI00215FA755|nr:recombinase family protein [Mesorhizobium sp. AR02]UVK55384.1 recombinase family protein [Mesorhizobium sp. AR02]
MSTPVKLRCAVYTRKSSEEGLDQEFNSLDAQREACVAYISSQVGLGWKLISDHYDDGGISGGTLERPALQRLLQDVRDRRIDVVVVYKIDRLTRSLMDFAKIVEIFDASHVSFVSVTQAFNTTSSMGRLTLNVLLSFAQFEREVTAERIRDKIAASRKKGLWMGGRVPLGYEVRDRKLVVSGNDANMVRYLFRRYLELKSVLTLADEVNGQQRDEAQTEPGSQGGARHGPWSRGKLYYLLSNQLYIGRVKHHVEHFEGEHEAIIDTKEFAKVQELLAEQSPRRQRSSSNATDVHLLTGIVFDETGDRLSPAHASNHGKRYRYYVSARLKNSNSNKNDGWRIPSHELEAIVEHQLRQLLLDRSRLADWIQRYASVGHIQQALDVAEAWIETKAAHETAIPLGSIFERITLSSDNISFQIDRKGLVAMLCDGVAYSHDENGLDPEAEASLFTIDLPVAMRRRGVEVRIVIENDTRQNRAPDAALIDLIARAHLYLAKLTDGSGQSIADVANHCRVHRADISRILPLAFLSPKIVEAILAGRQPADLTVRYLTRLIYMPLAWQDQDAVLGF